MHLTSHQYLDLVEMFEPVTKRSKQILRPDTVNEIVRIAFKYAESMHAVGYRVTKVEEFPDILREAFSKSVPTIIDCPVDYGENTKLTEYLKDLCEKLEAE